MIEPSGRVLYEIKWEGYDKKSDRTWEPEEHLDNSKDLLEEYLASIGGREALFAETTTALKTKKRGRQSSTPQTSGKRSRRENGTHPADSDRPASVEAALWRPPPGSWENDIADLDACEDEETGKLMVYLTWKNGKKTQHETPVIYQRCPQKVCFTQRETTMEWARLTCNNSDASVLRAPRKDYQEGPRYRLSVNRYPLHFFTPPRPYPDILFW